MFDDYNEHINLLISRKKYLNKVCGAIAIGCAVLFGLCFFTNSFLSLPIIKILLGVACGTDLLCMLAFNTSYDNAINAAKMAQIKKVLAYDDEDNFAPSVASSSSSMQAQNTNAKTAQNPRQEQNLTQQQEQPLTQEQEMTLE